MKLEGIQVFPLWRSGQYALAIDRDGILHAVELRAGRWYELDGELPPEVEKAADRLSDHGTPELGCIVAFWRVRRGVRA